MNKSIWFIYLEFVSLDALQPVGNLVLDLGGVYGLVAEDVDVVVLAEQGPPLGPGVLGPVGGHGQRFALYMGQQALLGKLVLVAEAAKLHLRDPFRVRPETHLRQLRKETTRQTNEGLQIHLSLPK